MSDSTEHDAPSDGPPVLRLERGNPTPEELAALTAVLLGRTSGPGAEPEAVADVQRARARWRRPERARRYACPRAWQSGLDGLPAAR